MLPLANVSCSGSRQFERALVQSRTFQMIQRWLGLGGQSRRGASLMDGLFDSRVIHGNGIHCVPYKYRSSILFLLSSFDDLLVRHYLAGERNLSPSRLAILTRYCTAYAYLYSPSGWRGSRYTPMYDDESTQYIQYTSSPFFCLSTGREPLYIASGKLTAHQKATCGVCLQPKPPLSIISIRRCNSPSQGSVY